MPKVRASMKDVSTDYSPIEPGVHRFEVREVTEHVDPDTSRVRYDIQSEVIEVIQDGNPEDVGRKLTDRIHIHKRDGDINDFGVAQLKRYFEVCVGEDEANDDDADTDWLIGRQFLGQVGISSYTVTDTITQQQEERRRNELTRLAPL
jgi:hypothetical protein